MFSGKRLKALRTAKGWSQKQLANEAGVSLMTVSSAETGERYTPNGNTQAKFAKALGVPVGAFYDDGQPLIVQISV